jgi:Cysteine protease
MERKKLIKGTYLIVMMTFLLSMFSIITLPTNALATPKMILGTAPLNPDYTAYMNNANSTNPNNSYSLDTDTNKFGYVPSPFSLFGKKPKNIEKTLLGSSQLPTSYDLRTKNKLTAVRDQGNSNSCWAFATYGSLESNLKTAESDDFSENNLKNRAGFDVAPNAGGNADMSIAYLSRWDGPVSEKDDPYNDTSTSSPQATTQKHVQEVLRFGDDNNYTDLKNEIMKNGAVYTTMYYQDENYDSKNTTYYYKGSEAANHAVVIVGWNDNFDKNKFADTSSGVPPGNGAFIVRNSWGSSWGDAGYFYVSYFDSLIGSDNVVFNNAEPVSNYSSVYQYDPLGETTPVPFPSSPNTVWFANVFTAKSNDALSAVSFYTNGPNSEYEVWLYAYNNGTLTKNKRLNHGSIEYAGYHTIKLSDSVELTSGSKFAVAVKLTTPSETKDEDPYLLALEEPVSGYSSQAESAKGQSFVSGDGSAWIDLKDTDHTNANVCLKAFTSPKTIKSLKVDQSSPTIVQGETQSISVQAVYSDGTTADVTSLIEAKSSDSDVAGVSSGKIEAVGPGKATLTLTYLNKTVTIKVTVIPTFELKANLNPITVEEDKSVKVKITADYTTGKSEDITNKVASWTVNPFETPCVSVKKGTFTGLIQGQNNVTVSYLGKSLTLPVEVIASLTTLTVSPDTLAIVSGDQITPQVFAISGKTGVDVSTICSAVSSKPSVASITNGVITGGSPGTAVITYTYGSKSTTLKVIVSPKLTKLEANKTSLTLEEKKSVSIKLTAFYSDGKKVDVTKKAAWTIDPGGEKYISISNGKITGLSTGTTQINVSYQDQTATISVSVIPKS